MFFQLNRCLLAIALTLSSLTSAPAQDFFTDTIAPGLRVGIEDFATVPNFSGARARMNLMTQDPLGRLFVNDQQGRIHRISSDGSSVTQFLNLNTFSGMNVINTSEQGFQSFAFHPDFGTSGAAGFGKFYTVHSSSNQSITPDFSLGTGNSFHTRLLEWTTNDPNAGTYAAGGNATPREVMRFGQPLTNHNEGQLSFNFTAAPGSAERNRLYLALGDGGGGGDPFEAGQNTANPFGAILRIDPLGTNGSGGKYGIVNENVFASDGNAGTLAEIYAYGFRNPQRFTWDSATGNMLAADIGQNAVEEIDLVINGGNYGWDQREGSFQFEGVKTADMIDPIFEYDHTNPVANMPTTIGNRAVTLGDVARGTGIDGLDGNLLLGDFPTGLIFYGNMDTDPLDGGQDGLRELVLVDAGGREVRLLTLINESRASQGLGNVTRADLRFSYGLNGDIFILNKQDGVIRRLVPLAIPEPSGFALLGLSLAVFSLRRSR